MFDLPSEADIPAARKRCPLCARSGPKSSFQQLRLLGRIPCAGNWMVRFCDASGRQPGLLQPVLQMLVVSLLLIEQAFDETFSRESLVQSQDLGSQRVCRFI